jgi:hypothetical protein
MLLAVGVEHGELRCINRLSQGGADRSSFPRRRAIRTRAR